MGEPSSGFASATLGHFFCVFREIFLLRTCSRSSSGGSPSRNLERDSRDYRKVFFAIYRTCLQSYTNTSRFQTIRSDLTI